MAGPDRSAQKDRTREAILAGARELLLEGKSVTVTAAAARSGVSKATAYRYFQHPATLAAESGLALGAAPLEDILGAADTLRDKLLAINLYFFDYALENEMAFRQFLASAVSAALSEKPPLAARRGARRVKMYKTVLASDGFDVADTRVSMLIGGLTTVTGIEAAIALLDVSSLDHATARTVVADATNALIDRFESQMTPDR